MHCRTLVLGGAITAAVIGCDQPRQSTHTASLDSALFSDDFDRPDSDDLGNGWIEVEGDSVARLAGGSLQFDPKDEKAKPSVHRTFTRQTDGVLHWTFDLDFERSGRDRGYSFYMQLGDSQLIRTNRTSSAGVAVNLRWARIDDHEALGYVVDGVTTQIAVASGLAKVAVEVDLAHKSYVVTMDGVSTAEVPFDNDVDIDVVRFVTHSMNETALASSRIDNVQITTDSTVCGDGSCSAGEDCSSCSQDCGVCGAVCGDGVCDEAEDCAGCDADCGECDPGPVACSESTRFAPSEPPPGTPSGVPDGVYYDIVYVRAPRYGDNEGTRWPEVKWPISAEPGTDLMLLHPDGSEEVLVDGGAAGAVIDPAISFDGEWVYYSYFPDVLDVANELANPPKAGSDVYKMNLLTKEVVRLTHQEWTPNTAAGDWSDNPATGSGDQNHLGYGIFNTGPMPLPDGRIMFTSSRSSMKPNKNYTSPNFMLYVMDDDGANVELIGHLNLGSALHPTVLHDGRVMFSSYETQGLRDQRLWGLWAIYPDGRVWAPLMSAFGGVSSFHFQTQLSSGDVAVVEYYNQNNNGFGTLLAMPYAPEDATIPPFGSADAEDPSNPEVQTGYSGDQSRMNRYSFSPQGLYTLTPFAHPSDRPSDIHPETGDFSGKVTHPSSAPHNDVLLVWSPGPANSHFGTQVPAYDGGIYVLGGGVPTENPNDLVLVKNSPSYNEQQPRAVVPYRDIYGIDQPANIEWLPNDGDDHSTLEAGTPFGLVGTASLINRATDPGYGVEAFDGLDPFNTSQNGISANWSRQGADAGKYSDEDIYAVRVLAMETASARERGPDSGNDFYKVAGNERLRILGELPVRKDGILDPDGNPDTSFLTRIPADTAFTFQTLDHKGMVLNMSQTWHQVRPGEARYDCGGCHAHDKMATNFTDTEAAKPGYEIPDMVKETPLLTAAGGMTTAAVGAVDVEYYRDIKPVLERSCGLSGCHSKAGTAAAGLVLDDDDLIDGYDGTYQRLCNDKDADWGIAPLVQSWRQTNVSRYVRPFQARRSLLIWKIFGERLDGWTNADHPTEAVPGDASTLPPGASANLADIDYIGTIMPPPDSGAVPLSDEEKLTFARWVDLGCPATSPAAGDTGYGWFLDEKRPTLTISSPLPGDQCSDLREISFGAFDYYSGLNMTSLSVTADFEVGGRQPGAELADLIQPAGENIWRIVLEQPITGIDSGVVVISIADNAGNLMRLERSFGIQQGAYLATAGNLETEKTGGGCAAAGTAAGSWLGLLVWLGLCVCRRRRRR